VSAYREQVALALRAVAVRSSTTYAWFGRASRPPRAASAAMAREQLVRRLEAELYRSFYVTGWPVPHRAAGATSGHPDPAFVDALSGANAGHGGWEPGWRVEAIEPTRAHVTRDGLRVRVPARACRPAPAAAGAVVSLRRDKEHRASSPGFYLAVGDAGDAGAAGALEVRVYLHVTPAGAVPLVASATRLLNAAGLPFALKVADHPAGFARRDAAVLYLQAGGFGRARDTVRAIASASRPHLRDGAPALTKPLGRGTGVAEHLPGSGASFGASRCRLLAEAIVAAHEERRTRLEDRLDVVARRFAEDDLDLDRPYLAPGSPDGYEL